MPRRRGGPSNVGAIHAAHLRSRSRDVAAFRSATRFALSRRCRRKRQPDFLSSSIGQHCCEGRARKIVQSARTRDLRIHSLKIVVDR